MPEQMNEKERNIFIILKCQIDFTSSWHYLYILLPAHTHPPLLCFLNTALISQAVIVSAVLPLLRPELLRGKKETKHGLGFFPALTSLVTHYFHNECASAVIRHMLPVGFSSHPYSLNIAEVLFSLE